MSRLGPARGVPPKSMVPLDGATSPAATRNTVVLPQPDGPMTHANLPLGILNEILSNTGRPAYATETSRKVSVAAPSAFLLLRIEAFHIHVVAQHSLLTHHPDRFFQGGPIGRRHELRH